MTANSPADFDSALASALDRHTRGVPTRLAESMRYSLLGPGKRIRPRLLLACAQMVGVPRETAFPAAIALEMIHCFTLIHDDLPCMDNDDFRRGRPSNHKQFDEATALLAGDGLMALALDAFADALPHARPEHWIGALKILVEASGPRGVIGGQAAEMALGPNATLDELKSMHDKKTGALFQASLLIPRELAGILPDDPRGRAIGDFARELGRAFQALDDLDDAAQDRRGGKTISAVNILHYKEESDVRRESVRALRAAQSTLSEAWGNPASLLIRISEEVASKLDGRESR